MDETQTGDIKMAAQWYTDLLSCATWPQLYTVWMKSRLKGEHSILKNMKTKKHNSLVAPRIYHAIQAGSPTSTVDEIFDCLIDLAHFYGAFVVVTTCFHIFILSRG